MYDVKTPEIFAVKDLRARDGTSLRVFQCGPRDGRPVVLVNAFGMPIEFMRPMAEDLVARRFRVVTWESRSVPNLEPGFTPENCSIFHHACDMADVMDDAGFRQASVLAWCSGAQVTLRFNTLFPKRIQRLVLLSGAYAFQVPGIFSDFQEKLNQLLPTCASSPEAADVVCQLIMAQLRGSAGTSETDVTLQSVMGTIPPVVLPMTSGAFSSGERLYRYANTEARFLEEPEHGWTQGMEAETFVITGDADHMTAPENSFEVARRISAAAVRVVPGGDHYMHYLRPDIRSELVEFLEKGARRDVARVAEAAV